MIRKPIGALCTRLSPSGATARREVALSSLAIIVLAVLPALLSPRLLSLAISVLILAIAAYGFVMSFGLVGSLSIGVAIGWGAGAFATAYLSGALELPFLVVLPSAVVASIGISLLVAIPCVRLGGHYFVIVTFAVAEILFILATQTEFLSKGGAGISTFATINVGPLEIASRGALYYLALVSTLAMGVLTIGIRSSNMGSRLLALRENEELAQSLGVNNLLWKLAAFGLSGIPLGVAGALYAYHLHSVTVEAFGILEAVSLLLIAILGGIRSAAGPIAGAFVVGFLPEALQLPPSIQQLAYGLAICLVVLFMRQGLVPLVLGAGAHKEGDVRLSSAGDEKRESYESMEVQ